MIVERGEISIEVVPLRESPDHAVWAREHIVAENDRSFGPDDWERFGLRATTPSEHVVGGVAGYTHWALGHIEHLWVHPERRRTRVASRLLLGAIRVMNDRGCNRVILETYSFQNALPFYQWHGFHVAMTVDDHPPGHRRWTLSRTLP